MAEDNAVTPMDEVPPKEDAPETEKFRVLLGVDDSENAEYAFDYYMKNLHRPGNELILLHVAESPSTMYMSGGVWEESVQREKDRTMALEKQCREQLEKIQVHGRFIANFGNKPGEMIVDTADKEKANLIVVGSRGQGKIRRTILGSVSDYVLHHAHCAVAVCRHEHHHHHHHFHLPGFHHHHHDKDKKKEDAKSK